MDQIEKNFRDASNSSTQYFSNVRSEVYLYGGHINTVEKGWSCQRHVHHMMFEINIVIDGMQAGYIGETQYNQYPGDIFLISPMQKHYFQAQQSEAMKYFVLHVQINDPHLLKLIEDNNESFYPKQHPLTQKLTPIIYEIYEHLHNESSNVSLFYKLYKLMYLLENDFGNMQSRLTMKNEDYLPYQITREIEKIVVRKDDKIHDNATNWLEMIASKLRISSRHCYRLFQKSYGMSPREYLNVLRQQEAMQMLANSDLSIKEIAYRIGYQNVQSFSRQFLKWTGYPPGEFRRKNRETLDYLTPLEVNESGSL